MEPRIIASYRACARMVRASGSNFPWTFYVLPREKRYGMRALYAFARKTDDLADGDSSVPDRSSALANWRADFERACGGEQCDDPLLPAVIDAIARFEIPREYFTKLIDGVESDLTFSAPETIDQLESYCFNVAAVVGLACVRIWGFTGSAEDHYASAVQCGSAFQWTNIVRDLTDDARLARCYIPRSLLAEFELTPRDFADPERLLLERRAVVQALLARLIALTEERYRQAAQTQRYLSSDGQRIFPLMFAVYRRLFEKLKKTGPELLLARCRLSAGEKLGIVTDWLRGRLNPY